MKDNPRSFRLEAATNIYLKEIAENYHVPETKIIESLVTMIHADVIPDPERPWTHDNYIDVESFEWFLKH